jgi:hypothetical protein
MSRTFKDQRDAKSKRCTGEPEFKQSYRQVLDHGFSEDINCDICPDCGAELNFEHGFLLCDECNWGSYYPEELSPNKALEFSDAA